MSKDELIQLAERVEKATGPDRELDRLIAPLVGIRVVEEGHPLGRCYYDENGHGVPLPLFTASLDAAMTLVPEGYNWGVGPWEDWKTGPRTAWAWCDETGEDWTYEMNVQAATPALALTAAALRALAATSEGSAS